MYLASPTGPVAGDVRPIRQVADEPCILERFDGYRFALELAHVGQAGQTFPAVDTTGAPSARTVMAGVLVEQRRVAAESDTPQHVEHGSVRTHSQAKRVKPPAARGVLPPAKYAERDGCKVHALSP